MTILDCYKPPDALDNRGLSSRPLWGNLATFTATMLCANLSRWVVFRSTKHEAHQGVGRPAATPDNILDTYATKSGCR